MAVQQNKKSRARRGMRRSHDALKRPTLSRDSRGELHYSHHMTKDGYHNGRKVLDVDKAYEVEKEE